MKPSDIKTVADVVRWLEGHVEWSDEASRDMSIAAVGVLKPLAQYDEPAPSTPEPGTPVRYVHPVLR